MTEPYTPKPRDEPLGAHRPADGTAYYNRQGQRIDLWTYANLHRDENYHFVAKDYIGDIRVSTIWFGIDMEATSAVFNREGPPIALFESCVFGGPLNGETQQYGTEAEAIEGHRALVEVTTHMMNN